MLIKVKYKVIIKFLLVLLSIPKIGNIINKESNDIR